MGERKESQNKGRESKRFAKSSNVARIGCAVGVYVLLPMARTMFLRLSSRTRFLGQTTGPRAKSEHGLLLKRETKRNPRAKKLVESGNGSIPFPSLTGPLPAEIPSLGTPCTACLPRWAFSLYPIPAESGWSAQPVAVIKKIVGALRGAAKQYLSSSKFQYVD